MTAAAGLLLAAGCVSAGGPAAPAMEPALEPVALTISNQSGTALRCVVVLAHFVTREIGPLPDGAAETVDLARDPAARAIAYGQHAGAPMMVENVLCGAAADWSATKSELPLSALRAGDGVAYTAVCRLTERIACAVN